MNQFRDLLQFMASKKRIWLAPIIIVLLLMGILIVFVEGSAVAPFIYSMF